ncbi:MAG: MFS transporter, partial [Sphingobium sp.]
MASNHKNDVASSQQIDFATRAIICLGAVPGSLAMMAISSVLPKIDAALAHNANDAMLVKQLVGGVGLAMIFGAPLGGFLVGHLGLRTMLVLASLLYAIAGTAGLYLDTLDWLLASRLLLGVMAAAIQVTVLTLINARLDGTVRAKWMGVHISMAMVVAIGAYPIAGVLGEISWRMPFLLYLMGLIIVPAALSMSNRTVLVAETFPAGAGENPTGEGFFTWFPFRYLALGLCTGTIMFMMNIYGPFLMHDAGVDSPTIISLILTADSIAGASMAMVYGRFRRRYSASNAFGLSFLMAATGAAIVAMASDIVGVFIGLLIFGIGGGWLVPNLLTSLAEGLQREQQGRAAGLVKGAHFAAAPDGVLVTAPIVERYG